MIHTGILKSWYVESVNFMVVLTFLCKMFHMCFPAVVTLVLYELFLPYIQLGKKVCPDVDFSMQHQHNNRNSASGHHCKEPGSVLFAPSLWVCRYTDEVPHPSPLIQSLDYLCGPLLDSSVCPCLSYWGAQNWMQNSSCGLTNAEERGSITSVVWLPAPSKCSPGYHLPSLLQGHIFGSWSMWCPSGHPSPFLARLLSSCAASSEHRYLELFLPRGRTWCFLFLNYTRFLSACPGFSRWQHSSFGPSAAPHSLVSSATLLRVYSLPHYADATVDLPKEKAVIFSK